MILVKPFQMKILYTGCFITTLTGDVGGTETTVNHKAMQDKKCPGWVLWYKTIFPVGYFSLIEISCLISISENGKTLIFN